MIEGTNFIGFSTSAENKEVIHAVNPETTQKLSEEFHVASNDEINRATEKAGNAFLLYRHISGEKKAGFLKSIADEIMALGDSLIERASNESALSRGRLVGERGRTCSQLHMFADLLREGSWVDARIDHADDGAPDIRNMLFPLGPVVVFGASNFPLAFSTAGGDTASALAAGCPVIVKSHESHLGTNELVVRAIQKAAQKTSMPEGVFNSLNGKINVGTSLVRHPKIKAVGFTGSFNAGTAIYKTVQQREEPIPVYAEMGSVNPIFLLQQKLVQETEQIAQQLADSVTLGGGQFCTNPGLIMGIEDEAFEKFKQLLTQKLSEAKSVCMLNAGIAKNYHKKRDAIFRKNGVEVLTKASDESVTYGNASVAAVPADYFLKNDELQEEVFGPATLLVSCKNPAQMMQLAKALRGQLTVTIMGSREEIIDNKNLAAICREKAGRVIFNGVPTGVRVSPAMQHGGPFPATTDAKFTSVGMAAIRRFVRPVAFQDCPPELLPNELKEENPLGIYRIVDGNFRK